MAPRNIMTSVPQPSRRRFAAPPSPGGRSDLIPDQDDILAELGLQVDDSASSVGGSTTGISTIDSGISVDGSGSGGGRRRRRRRNRNRNNQGSENNAININNNGSNGKGNFNKQATLTIPHQGCSDRDERPVKLKLGLDLDVDLELKAKLKGDICETEKRAERKTFSKRGSTRVKPNWRGEVDVEEIFHMRIGRFRFRQRWIEREVSESLTAAVAFCIAVGGFVAGLAASQCLG
ncbi:uncharacterized protein LY79DRAFT_666267 [Colletotrichum navitas]|uniref:Uncharacterized protein n=1 Tax=Colletotrichum navitas TaxID=681940 RepID=A0AAD8V9F3_9PEZI|nr:uncharacterized protein LY79DRAFT_666267 [Colletotrichum navitas]KAK1597919.1 hypothetical protein LY79DRAFT_666267 [Colletotrichum navitas]